MKKFLALMCMLPTMAHAGLYLELGVAKGDSASCIQRYDYDYTCSESPLGIASFGYEYKGLMAEVQHISSLSDGRDYGLNLFTIKYRFNLTK